jgi:hypothetical protein
VRARRFSIFTGNLSTESDIAGIQAASFNAPRYVYRPTFRRESAPAIPLIRVRDMGFRFPPLAMMVLVVGAVVLLSSRSWAVYYELGPSKDEWGLKYDGDVTVTNEGKLNVLFTLADQGRLKPIHSVHIFALSRPNSDGSRTYLLKAPMAMTPTQDGKLTGQMQIGRELTDLAVVRIFSYSVDGQPQKLGVRYYDIPLRKFMKKAPVAASPRSPFSIAAPPAWKVTR